MAYLSKLFALTSGLQTGQIKSHCPVDHLRWDLIAFNALPLGMHPSAPWACTHAMHKVTNLTCRDWYFSDAFLP
jgi:hypothetical protein